jgi:hypothetical protein
MEVQEAFKTLSPFELQLIMRASACKIVHRYCDKDPSLGTQRYSKGNLMSVMQDSLKLRNHLPPSSDEIKDTVAVLFVGQELPTKENIEKLKPVLISKSKVKVLISFLIENNPYFQVTDDFEGFSQEAFDSYVESDPNSAGPSSLPAELSVHHLTPNDANSSLESDYTDRNEMNQAGECESDDLLMENVSYTNGDRSQGSYTSMKLCAVQHCLMGKKFLLSRRGSQPLSDFESKEMLTWLFPHLDPWGIGGFFEPRRA